MLNEWSDRLPREEAADLWQRAVDREVARRTALLERELRTTVTRQALPPANFYDAMYYFLALREKMFPNLPADPAWKILVTLARTEEDSAKASTSGIAYGADVPLTTALRYIAVMEVNGLIERVSHPSDKRQVMIRLTKEGRRRLDAVADSWSTRLFLILSMPIALLLVRAIC